MASAIPLEWVAQPQESQEILREINSSAFLIIQSQVTTYSSGAYRYFYLVKALTPDYNYEDLQARISRLTYLPLTFTFNMVGIEITQQRQYAKGLRNIILAFLTTKWHMPIVQVEAEYLQDPSTLLLKPITPSGDLLYISKGDQERFQQLHNYDFLVGYDLLSADPLIWFYLAKETPGEYTSTSRENPFHRWNLVSWEQMALFPIFPPTKEDPPLSQSDPARVETFLNQPDDVAVEVTSYGLWWTQRDLFVEETRRFANSWRRERYFPLIIPSNLLPLTREIATEWKINYYGEFPIAPSLASKEEVDFISVFSLVEDMGVEVSTWFRQALDEIQLGRIPSILIGGEWVQFVEPLLSNMARLQYAAIRSYQRVAFSKNPLLLQFIGAVKCLPNLLLTARFTSWEEVTTFRNFFQGYLALTQSWQVIVCPDEATCSLRAQQIKDKDSSLQPHGFILPADPDQVYLVVNTPPGVYSVTFRDDVTAIQDITSSTGLNIDMSWVRSEGNNPQDPTQANAKIEVLSRFQLEPSYFPHYHTAYTFSLINAITKEVVISNLITMAIEDPIAVLQEITLEDLLAPWGKSYLRKYPQANLHRGYFLPKRQLIQLLRQAEAAS